MNTGSSEVIAIFDFDGTLTNRDTLFDFIRFYYGMPRLIAGLFLLSPTLIFFKLGFMTNDRAKEMLFSYFFKRKAEADFNAICEKYKKRINEILIPEAIDKIKYHRQEGHTILINSASICNWIIPWAQSIGINGVIGTQMETENGLITGKFRGNNCYGEEKVRRFLKLYPDRQAYQLYVYGDSKGDKPLLDMADFPFYKTY
jgi:HAD superfamily hydrolase (TIGR01490 family)